MNIATLLVSGLAVGALYGLIAMGFALVYKVSRVVNFAHGDVMMLIAYIAFTVAGWTNGSTLLVALSVVASAVVVGLLIERFVVRPMLGQPIFAIVMMTIALSVLIRSVVGLIWGSFPYRFPGSELGGGWQVAGLQLQPVQIVLFAIYLSVCAGVFLFLRYTVVGIAMRATAADPMVSLLMGVSVSRLYRLAWIMSAFVAGIAGVLFANIYHIGPDLTHAGIRAFPATILGGLDSILGSALGGLIIGVVENFAGGFIGSGWKEVSGFAVIVLVMMIRPYGLFGEEQIERV